MTDGNSIRQNCLVVELVENRLRYFRASDARQFSQYIDPSEDFCQGLMRLAQEIIYSKGELQGAFIDDIRSLPLSLFSQFREFMLVHGVRLWGCDSGSRFHESDLIDLCKNKIYLDQFDYEHGPLNGQRIPKYGWYDGKFFHCELDGNECAVYGTRVINSHATIAYLGRTAIPPHRYVVYTIHVSDGRNIEGRIDDAIASISLEPGCLAIIEVDDTNRKRSIPYWDGMGPLGDELKTWLLNPPRPPRSSRMPLTLGTFCLCSKSGTTDHN